MYTIIYTHTVIYPNIILFNISNGAYNMYECADCENIVLSLGTHGSEVNLSGIKRSSCPFMPRQKALSFQHIFRPKIDVDEANIGGINRANPQIHWSILIFLLEISLQWNIRNNNRKYRQQIIRIISLYSYLLISFFCPPQFSDVPTEAQVLEGIWKCIRRVRAALWLRLLFDRLCEPLRHGSKIDLAQKWMALSSLIWFLLQNTVRSILYTRPKKIRRWHIHDTQVQICHYHQPLETTDLQTVDGQVATFPTSKIGVGSETADLGISETSHSVVQRWAGNFIVGFLLTISFPQFYSL